MKRGQFIRAAYRALSIEGSVHAARRGVGPLARRVVRQRANRSFNRALRRVFRP